MDLVALFPLNLYLIDSADIKIDDDFCLALVVNNHHRVGVARVQYHSLSSWRCLLGASRCRKSSDRLLVQQPL